MRIFSFFFKQKTAYDLRISDWSSYVFSSDLHRQKLAVDEVDRPDHEQHRQRDGATQRESAVGRDGASIEGSRLCHHTLQKRTSLPVAKILRYLSLSVNVLYGNRKIYGREDHGYQGQARDRHGFGGRHRPRDGGDAGAARRGGDRARRRQRGGACRDRTADRKSTRLNSSH